MRTLCVQIIFANHAKYERMKSNTQQKRLIFNLNKFRKAWQTPSCMVKVRRTITTWKKTSYRRPVDNVSPRSSRSPTVSPCCNTVQVRYKSFLFILHFHLAGMNRGEPGRTVAPPWRTGKNRSVTGVLPAWIWVNRGEPARTPG